jgi:hypothetical protein
MKFIVKVFLCAFIFAWSYSAANAYTLTFDEFPSGTELYDSFYYDVYGAAFGSGFKAVDHTASTWGVPNSMKNVLRWDGDYLFTPGLWFGRFTPSSVELYDISSVGAYFSTQPDAMVKITAYYNDSNEHTSTLVTSIVIGAEGESWTNRYVEINSPNDPFNRLEFEYINSISDLRGFCADDMTVTPVPEPSSVLALVGGIAGLGGFALRRRRS